MQAVYDLARNIRLMIFDVDGVLTDGSLFLGDDGQEYKAFNSLDGHGIKMLKNSGVEIAIITGRTSKVVVNRAQNLGIDHLYQGVHDKLEAFQHLVATLNVSPDQCAFMGDDVVDLPVMRRCGLAVTVAQAPDLVKRFSHFVTQREGGRGAAREVCELIMQAQGTLEDQLSVYLK
jgi:3-deoxy-D-manno-octulosonate 8-phosphate phosphatase (KDO 8-P phosphatase)